MATIGRIHRNVESPNLVGFYDMKDNWPSALQGDPEDELLAVFNVFDRDNNGTVSKEDLKQAFRVGGCL